MKTDSGTAAVRGWLLWLGLLLAGQVSADQGAFSDYQSQVADGVVLAGTLDLEALRASHNGTIRVVDLRTEPEGTPEEEAEAEKLGLEYTNIPVPGAVINPDQVAELRTALAGAEEGDLVVVHCASGNRAGMLWGAMKLEAGVPLEQVQENVSGVVTKAPVSEALEAYAKSLDAGL
jgi:uncharacterized protein (TIGR01244 family)